MAYEDYEKVLIKGYQDEVEAGRIMLGNPDISSGKARNKYQQYIGNIRKLNLIEHPIESFPIIGIDRVIELASAIIITIYGEKTLPILESFIKVLYLSETKSALDGISLSITDTRTNEINKIVEVPDMKYSSTVIAIVHEFTHYLVNQLKIDFAKKRYYEEILSIYAEKIANLYVNQELGLEGPIFSQKIEECRLEGIAWHYGENIPSVEELLAEYRKLKNKKNPNFAEIQAILSLECSVPMIKTAYGQSILKGYYQMMADSYGIGYLYSETLYQKHLDDYHTLGIQIRKLLDHEQSFQDLLNYYDINARNYRVYEAVDEKIEIIRRGR